jgi:D-alanyl-D-alanine carboxypeptidase
LAAFPACASSTVGTNPVEPSVPTPAPLASVLQGELASYLASYAKAEHISAISLSVGLHGQTQTIDVAAGTFRIGGGAAITPQNAFQIGSNTKAFTAVALLHLERDGKLSIEDTVGKWLPQYPQWKNVTIEQMLNMTSGIATYDNTKAWAQQVIAHPSYDFTTAQLIGYIYPEVPKQHVWLYSNTGYILSQLIVERASGEPFTQYMNELIAQAGLHHTFYEPNVYPPSVYDRVPAGYYNNTDPGNEDLAPLLGVDVRDYSLSWTQGAGGIVSTPSDIAQWARDLYAGPILTAGERAELESLVSTTTGEPIKGTSKEEPRGFGLGVTQVLRQPFGTFWFYEGETLGYRVAHVYVPATDTTIVVALNSQTSPSTDQAGPFLGKIYVLLEQRGLVKPVGAAAH